MTRSLPRRLTATGLILLAALSCTSSTEPTRSGAREVKTLTVGDSLDVSLPARDTVDFRIDHSNVPGFALHDLSACACTVQLTDSAGVVVATAHTFQGMTTGHLVVLHPKPGPYRLRLLGPLADPGGTMTIAVAKVDVNPEHGASVLTIGDTLTEAIDDADDWDAIAFHVTAGKMYEIYAQSLVPGAAISAAVYRDSADADNQPVAVPGPVQFTGPDSSIEAGGVHHLTSTTDAWMHFRISSFYGHQVGGYRLAMYEINPAPEHASATVAPGDTVAEAIDHVGDYDDFTLTGTPGAMYELFMQAQGDSNHSVTFTLPGPDFPTTYWATARHPLLDQPSGRFTMPASGSISLHVEDAAVRGRGAYRFFAYPIDTTVENGSDTLSLARTIVTGRIDQLGDIDVYHFTLSDSSWIQFLQDSANPVKVELFRNGEPLYSWGLTWPAGNYSVRVSAPSTSDGYRGDYRFIIYKPDPNPESVSSVIMPGDTVRGESLAWPFDVDHYRLALAPSDTVLVEFHPSASDSTGAMSAYYLVNDDPAQSWGSVGFPDGHWQLPMSSGADTLIGVGRSGSAWGGSDISYTITTRRVSAAPEHRAAAATVGDTIRDSLDFYGDIDDYTLSAPAGSRVYVRGAYPLGYSPPEFVVFVIDPANDSVVARTNPYWQGGSSNAVVVPASGTLKLRACMGDNCRQVWIPGTMGNMWPLLGYRIYTDTVNTAPEHIASTFPFDSTITGESLETPNDADKFTFTANAGDTLVLTLAFLNNPTGNTLQAGLLLTARAAGQDSVLAHVTSNGDSTETTPRTTTFVAPASGTYELTVEALPEKINSVGRSSGAYSFRVDRH